MGEEQAVAVEAPKVGIENMKEILVALNEVGVFIAKRAKDGLGVDDAIALGQKILADDEFKAVVIKAYLDAAKVPAEISDLDLQEGIELASLQLSYLPKYFA